MAAHRVGLAHHARHVDGRVAQQAILDFRGSDPIAGRGDHVVVPPDKGEPAVRSPQAPVAGLQPAPVRPVHELGLRGLGIVPVFQKHHRIGRLHGDLALGIVGQDAAGIGVDHRDLMARCRAAHGAGHRLLDGRTGRDDHVAFGLAVEFVDGGAEHLPAPVQQLAAHRLAPAGQGPQAQPPFGGARFQPHQLQRGGRQEGVAHALVAHQVERGLRGELAEPAGHNRDAVIEARQQHIQQPADPGPVRRGPQPVARLGQQVVADLDPRQMAQQDAMRMQRALGVAGGPRGIDQDRRIVRPGRRGRIAVGLVGQGRVQIGDLDAGEPRLGARGQVLAQDQAQVGQVGGDPGQNLQAGRAGDDRGGCGIAQPVAQRLGAEQHEQGQRHAPHPRHGDMGHGGVQRLRHQHGNPVARRARPVQRDAAPGQDMRQARGPPRQMGIGMLRRRAGLVHLDDRQAVGIARGPVVADRHADVEIGRNPPVEIARTHGGQRRSLHVDPAPLLSAPPDGHPVRTVWGGPRGVKTRIGCHGSVVIQ